MDALEEAKQHLSAAQIFADDSSLEETQAFAQLAIAAALIALVERLDKMTVKLAPEWEDSSMTALVTYSRPVLSKKLNYESDTEDG